MESATTYLYDRYGRDTSVTDLRGTWRLRYDAVRGVLDTITTPYGDTLHWTIDPRGRAVGPYISNGTNPDYAIIPTWSQVGKLIALRDTHTVNVGRWQVDTMEPNLHLLPLWTETHGSGGATVTAQDTVGHDGWDRVVEVAYFKNGSLLDTARYSFDRDGNIRVGKLGAWTRTYDVATTRLTDFGSLDYRYDRAGNLDSVTSGTPAWKFVYDALDRLIEVRSGGTLISRYAYDVLGRRIVKRVYSGAGVGYVRMIYRGSTAVAEADSAGALMLGYTSGLGVDNLIAIHRYSDGSDYYVVQDALHSVRGLSRRDGTWIASWRYGIYGEVIDSAGSAPFPLRYRWTGRELDVETGLYYFRARYYDPAAQRFVQADPIGFAGGVNLYAYGDGNPVNGRDPMGLRFNYEQYALDPNKLAKLNNCWSDSCTGAGGGGADWNWDGIDDWYYFVETSWLSQQTGLTIAALEYAWAIGAGTYSGTDRNGNPIAGFVPQLGDKFVNRLPTVTAVELPSNLPQVAIPQPRACGINMSGAFCDATETALAFLRNHGVPICRELGGSATTRFDQYQFELRDLGPGALAKYEGDLTVISPLAFAVGAVSWAIAHEEAHHHGIHHGEMGRMGMAMCDLPI